MNLLVRQFERKFIYKLLSCNSNYLSCLSKLNCSTTNDPNLNGFQLSLYNHYTRSKEPVEVDGSPVTFASTSKQSSNKSLVGTAYVCGPTVYDYCHIGHAMAYTRFDIFRRFLGVYSNIDLVTAMGITDIDEKIMTRSSEEGLSYKAIGDKYFAAFLEDLKALNIIPVDIFVRITDHIDEIIDYIARLESKGCAYINTETGDINFDTSAVKDFDVKADLITTKSKGKKSPKDFALWRSASNEPKWIYQSPLNGQNFPGRPGWHVECSVIASWLYGSSLDFHFGGKDLIYPHHFCESACSAAYFDLVDKQPAIKWASHWFHSSHIRLSKEKMSKSLGNVIFIKDFLEKYNANILRIMCAYYHYRFDFEYDSLIIKRYNELDRIFKQFSLSIKEKLLSLGLYRFQNDKFLNCEPDDGTLFNLIKESRHEILAGAADDWNLHRGLVSILDIIKYFDNLDNPTLIDLYCIKKHVFQWMCALGLNYPLDDTPNNVKQDLLLLQLINYRKNIRDLSLKSLQISDLTVDTAKENFAKILKTSDEVREKIESLGYVIKDSKFKPD